MSPEPLQPLSDAAGKTTVTGYIINCLDRDGQHCAAGYHGTLRISGGVCEVCERRRPKDVAAPAIRRVTLTVGRPQRYNGAPEWRRMHLRHLRHTGPADAANELRELASLRTRLPCGECTDHFDALCAASPPPVAGKAAELFAWGVAGHNNVNARLNSRAWTVHEAENHWRAELAKM